MELERSDVERLVRVEEAVGRLETWSKVADGKLNQLLIANAKGEGFLSGAGRIAPWAALAISIVALFVR